MADWVTISSLATAGGTLVLAVATFASVRSANRAARVAEHALQVGLRPVLAPSRPEDPPEKVNFGDDRWFHVPAGGAVLEVGDPDVYLVIPVRNLGNGFAVLHGWQVSATWDPDPAMPDIDGFRRQVRDLYIPAGGTGFWQGRLRGGDGALREDVRDAILGRRRVTVDMLYGDQDGGQRTISRFVVSPREDEGWWASIGRHWNVDGAEPR